MTPEINKNIYNDNTAPCTIFDQETV